MSVPVSKRGSNKYDPVEKARELAVYTLRITKNEKVFVGEYREAVAEKISNLAIGIYIDLWNANDVRVGESRQNYQRRRNLQISAGSGCNQLLPLIQLAHSVYHLNSKRVGYWSRKVIEVRSLTKEWIESDRTRWRNL